MVESLTFQGERPQAPLTQPHQVIKYRARFQTLKHIPPINEARNSLILATKADLVLRINFGCKLVMSPSFETKFLTGKHFG